MVEEKEITKVDAPEIEGPKVLDKIDLSAIDSSTRPKKGAKKKTEKEEPAEEIKPAAKKTGKSKKDEVVAEEPVEETKEVEDVVASGEEEIPPVIENIKAEKIEGPKILGKIDLPVDSDTRPKKEEKRKRKRIPIEKKEVKREDLFKDRRDGNNRPPGQFNRGGGGGNRPGDRRGPGGPGGGRRDIRRREDKEIDQKEIQEKIRETQAKLSGGSRGGKGLKARLRREKRQEMAEAMGETTDDNKLQVTEFISVSELANLMDVNFADVISKCMSLGIMVSINQRLDAEVIELVASEFGYDVEFIDMEEANGNGGSGG